jgi:predicted amino acid racemase
MAVIEVDCERIRENARAVVALCAPRGIEVAGVVKGCCGDPDVARAMLAGGVAQLADSRLANVRRLREAGIACDVLLLRVPAIAEADDVVALTDYSLNSEIEAVRALSCAAIAQGRRHGVIVMIETGDRREGVMPDDAVAFATAVTELPGVELVGVGTNLSCIGGVLCTPQNEQLMVDVAEQVEQRLGLRLRFISGGHTGSLPLVMNGTLPARVNHLRVGEAILIGTEQCTFCELPVPHRDAFTVRAAVIELKTKPSLPEGPVGPDAFMNVPTWEDRGPRLRAIVALGEHDLRTSALLPRRAGVVLVGASSDHLVLDVTDAAPPVRLGEELEFGLLYAAMATGWASTCIANVVHPCLEAPAPADTGTF